MRAISELLVHFLGKDFKNEPNKQFEIFQSIINDGLRCSKIDVKFGFEGCIYGSAVCFTDIPLNFCDEHTAFYGKFGIAFTKAFVKDAGGNPAHYFVDYAPSMTNREDIVENRGLLYMTATNLFKNLLTMSKELQGEEFKGLYDHESRMIYTKDEFESFANHLQQFLTFMKPMGDLGPARDGSDQIDQYYKEREWRIVPYVGSIMSGRAVISPEDHIHYKFKRRDVKLIIVPNNEIRKKVIEWFAMYEIDDEEYAEDPPPVLVYDDLSSF
jgi:hypothetical protein